MDKAESMSQRIGKTVCYVVAVVMIEKNKILMVQEAKRSCHGKWYLPAGRVEHGETFDKAARREAMEESGLLIKVEALTYVEVQGSSWMRFTFTGRVAGGDLKDEPDKESLKAEWLDLEMVMAGGSKEYPLRSYDIATNIQATRKFLERSAKPSWFLPSRVPHPITEVALLLIRNLSNGQREFLANSVDSEVPCSILSFRSVFVILRDLYTSVFPDRPGLTPDQLSVVDVEFSGGEIRKGQPADGCRIVFTADVTGKPTELRPDGRHQWLSIDLMTEKVPGASWCSRVKAPSPQLVSVNFL